MRAVGAVAAPVLASTMRGIPVGVSWRLLFGQHALPTISEVVGQSRGAPFERFIRPIELGSTFCGLVGNIRGPIGIGRILAGTDRGRVGTFRGLVGRRGVLADWGGGLAGCGAGLAD